MKYDKKDLMNEGWNAMETLLNEEMPTKSKNFNYLLIGLLVFVAFSGGYILGTSQLGDTKTAELENITIEEAVTSSPTETPKVTEEIVTKKNPIQKFISKIGNRKSSSNSSTAKTKIVSENQSIEKAEATSAELNATSLQNSNISDQVDQNSIAYIPSNTNTAIADLDLVMVLSPDQVHSQGLAVSYLPRSNSKVKKATNWVLGLGLSSGINPSRNTKVASLKSEWMYKVGKQNAIGLEFIYAAEDKFGFLNFGEEPITPARTGKDREEINGRDKVEQLIQNSRQFRYAAGLVMQQDFGYRLYSNLGVGINLIQNSYSNELAYKSLNTIDNIKYHWGGYTSLAFGYRISKLIDIELSGTKSLLGTQGGEFQGGSTDQITGGLKISF